MYKIEYQRHNGEWHCHSGHLPLPEADAKKEATAAVNSGLFKNARLVGASTGCVHWYVNN